MGKVTEGKEFVQILGWASHTPYPVGRRTRFAHSAGPYCITAAIFPCDRGDQEQEEQEEDGE